MEGARRKENLRKQRCRRKEVNRLRHQNILTVYPDKLNINPNNHVALCSVMSP